VHTIVLDQLVPEITHYYCRDEVEALFAGLEIRPNRGYSWTVLAERA
jgi:hypothetical protein